VRAQFVLFLSLDMHVLNRIPECFTWHQFTKWPSGFGFPLGHRIRHFALPAGIQGPSDAHVVRKVSCMTKMDVKVFAMATLTLFVMCFL
jgi:hypothetical protein